MGRDVGFFVLAGGSVARPPASAIEPDRPRTLVRRAGPPTAPFSGIARSDVKQRQALPLHLAPRQANVYLAAHDSGRQSSQQILLSCNARPDEDGVADNRSNGQCAEIAAVEAVGMIGKQKYFPGLQCSTAVPAGQRSTGSIGRVCRGRQFAANRNAHATTTDGVAGEGDHGLDKERPARKVAPTRSQRREARRQTDQHEVADLSASRGPQYKARAGHSVRRSRQEVVSCPSSAERSA